MSEFDKWWEENYMNVSADRTEAEDIYNLGVESQQAKIDKLKSDNQLSESQIGQACVKWKEIAEKRQAEIDEMQEQLRIEREQGTEYFTDTHSLISERDELQARVDRVVHILTYTNHASTPLCNELRDILKGNKDEN